MRVTCLPEILAAAGYETRWFDNFDARFKREGDFLRAHGMQRIADGPSLGWPDRLGFGVSDRALFSSAIDDLSQARAPFYAVVTTGSSHVPFAIPAGVEGARDQAYSGQYGAFRRALSYAD